MLYDLEPSTEITGGPWFSDNELDSEFIEGLMKACLKFIYSRSFPRDPASIFPASYTGYATLESVHRFIVDSGICTIELSEEDILCLIEALEFDGKIQRIIPLDNKLHSDALSRVVEDETFMSDSVETYYYKACKEMQWPHMSEESSRQIAYLDIPCSVCPVVHECTEMGPISPPKCDYLTRWIDMV